MRKQAMVSVIAVRGAKVRAISDGGRTLRDPEGTLVPHELVAALHGGSVLAVGGGAVVSPEKLGISGKSGLTGFATTVSSPA